jgi:hypothetical protein
VRFSKTAELAGALPEDRVNPDWAERVFPKSNGTDKAIST